MTVPVSGIHDFGATVDNDDINDPELTEETLNALTFYVAQLAPPQPKADLPDGRRLFELIGCADCHVPRLAAMEGDVDAYTDLLLHETASIETRGVLEGAGIDQRGFYLFDSSVHQEYRWPFSGSIRGVGKIV